MSAALDLRSHYKAVRQRIHASAVRALPPPPDCTISPAAVVIYAEPIGPSRPLFADMAVSRTPMSVARGIVTEVAEKHGLTVEQLVGDCRMAAFIKARHELYWRLHTKTEWSLARIGRFVDRDHTSVRHGVIQYRKRNGL